MPFHEARGGGCPLTQGSRGLYVDSPLLRYPLSVPQLRCGLTLLPRPQLQDPCGQCISPLSVSLAAGMGKGEPRGSWERHPHRPTRCNFSSHTHGWGQGKGHRTEQVMPKMHFIFKSAFYLAIKIMPSTTPKAGNCEKHRKRLCTGCEAYVHITALVGRGDPGAHICRS